MMWRLVLLLLLVLSISVLASAELLSMEIDLPEREDLDCWVNAAGSLGPILVVVLMTVAIVASPLPSAPIALTAGDAYGHTLGTFLVVIGSELGPLAAFLLAHWLGRHFVERHFGKNTGPHFLGV